MATLQESLQAIISSPTQASIAQSIEHAADVSVDEHVWLVQIRSIFKQYKMVILGTTPGAFLLVYLLSSFVDHYLLWGWFVAVVVFNGLYVAVLIYIFKRNWPYPQGHVFWRRVIDFNGILSGTLWGCMPWLFFTPGQLEIQLAILLWIWIVPLLGSAILMTYKQGNFIFIITLLGLASIRFGMEGDFIHYVLMGVTLFCMVLLIYFTNTNHNTLLDSIRLRFENELLVNELTVKKAQAEQAVRAKSQFLAAASHDLRQPLHAQGLFLAELQNCVEGEHAQKILSYLASTTETMGKLFDALLNISSLEAGVVQPKVTQFSIYPVMRDLVREYGSQAKGKGLRLDVVQSRLVVQSDPVLLTRILRNFLVNAIRYTAQGRILFGCRRQGGCLRIEVWDTGVGIPVDKKLEIFQEFRQLGNPERDLEKGLGLGLAIVARIAALLGHPIDLRSVPQKGACFSVTIPVVDAVDVEKTVMPNSVTNINTDELRGVPVVVIDDELSVRVGMRALLERWGSVVLDGESAQDVMNKLPSWGHAPGILIADYRLREQKTGVQAITDITALIGKKIPSILITGDTSPERLREINDSGYRVLHKPVHPAKLRALLGFELGQARR